MTPPRRTRHRDPYGIVEVALGSPEALVSIHRLARGLEGHAEIGADTVVRAAEVAAVVDAGGRFGVAPNTDPAVIRAAHDPVFADG